MFRALFLMSAFVVGLILYHGKPTLAYTDIIAERQSLMKQAGKATSTASKIIKEEIPFDEAKVREIFNTYLTVSEKMLQLFPDGSDIGNTTASSAIWEDKPAFDAEFLKFGKLAKQGLAANNLDSFKTAFNNIGRECGNCHQTFRMRK